MTTRRNNQSWLPDVFNDFFDNEYLPKANATAPAINVIEKEKEYDVEVAAPGLTKDDFKVSLNEDDNLEIAIEKEAKDEKKEDGKYLRREFFYSQFHQELILPDDVDKEKISASVNNGVLSVVLPKVSQEELKKEAKVIDVK